MSHIGSKEIKIPDTVQVDLVRGKIAVTGLLGKLYLEYTNVDVEDVQQHGGRYLKISPSNPDSNLSNKKTYMLWGLYRTLIENMIIGVTQGYTCSVELIGVGYKATIVDSTTLSLKVGNSIDILYTIPMDVRIECSKPTFITVSGIDKQRVHQVAAEIRSYRKPEPYKGKGIRYVGEVVRTKEGKKK